MNPYLAAMYNTHGTGAAIQAEQVKLASLDLFAKAAAAEGINLGQLPEEEKVALYNEFISKLAESEEEEKKEGPEHEKKEPPKKEEGEKEEEEEEKKAQAEFDSQQEFLQKQAEADFLGRQMAHAFWDEFQGIQKLAAEKEESKEDKAEDKKEEKNEKKEEAKEGAARIGNNFDKQAYARAIAIAQSSPQIDTDEAIRKLAAVVELGGPGESEKVAYSKGDYEFAKNIRGLEYLEAAGYPVDWQQVFKG